jgi:drug/metabolite transporter (DMT)-like permease
MTAPGDAPGRAALWAIGAGINYVIMVILIRNISDHLPAGDITFYRVFFGVLLMLPLFLGGGVAGVKQRLATRRLGLFWLRACFTYAAVLGYFYAVVKLPLAEAIALNSTLPICTAALAALVLRESVGTKRWIVVLVGFAGALVIVRPGFAVMSWAALAALASAALYAAAGICVKVLARTEPVGRIVFYMNLMIAVLAAGPVIYDGTLPRWSDLPWIIGIGAAGSMAHYCNSNALKLADASFVAPFDFTRLPLGALAGWALFADHVSPWVWPGAALIFGSAVWLARAERLARPRPPSPRPATSA